MLFRGEFLTCSFPQQQQPRKRSCRPWGCYRRQKPAGSKLPWRDLPLKSFQFYSKWAVCRTPVLACPIRCVDKCGRKIFVHIVVLLYQKPAGLQVFLCGFRPGGTSLLLLAKLNDRQSASFYLIQHKWFSVSLNRSKASTFINYPSESSRLL